MARLGSKTDNSFRAEKIAVRLEALESVKSDSVRVLDCFSGNGLMWEDVARYTDKKVSTLRIEKEPGKCLRTHLIGDNMKFLPSLNLNDFDVIDLDAYGVPFGQLQEVLRQDYSGAVVVTCVQTFMGALPVGLLESLGFTDKMREEAPALIGKHGAEKLLSYLGNNGVERARGFWGIGVRSGKNYFWFSTAAQPSEGRVSK